MAANPPTHDEVRELLPLFALGTLAGSEDCDLVCSHFSTGCPTCAEELAGYTRTAATISEALPAATPSPKTRAALEATLRKTSQGTTEAALGKVIPLEAGIPRWAFTLAASIAVVALAWAISNYD